MKTIGIDPRKRSRRTRPKGCYVGSEDSFQKAVARYLDGIQVLWMHVPNGGSRNKIEAAKMKGMGVKKGVPDCWILEPRGGYSGLIIELKIFPKKPTEEQVLWMEKLEERGYKAALCYGLGEVFEAVKSYLL